MKSILILILFVVCGCELSTPKQKLVAKSENLGYNPATDKMINETISQPVVSKEKQVIDFNNSIQYRFYYKELKIGIVHYLYKEFSQKEHWTFSAVSRDGENIMLESYTNLPLHMVSPTTYERLKSLCNF